MNKMPKLICIIGIDGSGKTAHARKLISEIKKSGSRCKYVWFREPFFFSFPFMFLCRILGFVRKVSSQKNQIFIQHEYYEKPIALIWPWIRLIDVIIFLSWKVYVPIWRGITVVCDRFIHDIIVDTMVDINDFSFHMTLPGQLVLKLVPPSAVVVLLDVDEKIAFQRKGDIPYLKYLTGRKKLYLSLATYLKILIIDTEQLFITAHKVLLKKIYNFSFEN